MKNLLMAVIATIALSLISTLSDAEEQARISDVEYCERVDQYEIHGDRGHRNFENKDCDAIFEAHFKKIKK